MFKNKTAYLFLQIAIWCLGAASMIALFLHFYTPIYANEMTSPANFGYTEALHSKDVVSQSFTADRDSYEGFEFAFFYDEKISSEATSKICIFHEDTLVLEQPLAVKGTQNQTFLYLNVPIKNCLGDKITLEVENASPSSSDTFSLLTAEPLSVRPSNLDNYSFNEKEQDTCLLFRLTYCTGYTYYKALSGAFFALIITLAASAFVTSKRLHT